MTTASTGVRQTQQTGHNEGMSDPVADIVHYLSCAAILSFQNKSLGNQPFYYSYSLNSWKLKIHDWIYKYIFFSTPNLCFILINIFYKEYNIIL